MTTAAARASEQRQDEAASSRLGTETTTDETALQTVRRGLALAPEALRGVWITLLLAVIATAGKVVVPIAVQSILDEGIIAPEIPDVGYVAGAAGDRKSTRLNSSHVAISYAVFCLKKKKNSKLGDSLVDHGSV